MAAIYQWFEGSRFQDYEYVLFAAEDSWYQVHYIGMNYDSGQSTSFGGLYSDGNMCVLSDGKNVIVNNGDRRDPNLYVHRGHAFTHKKTGDHGANNSHHMSVQLGLPDNDLFIVYMGGWNGVSPNISRQSWQKNPPYTFGALVEEIEPGGGGDYLTDGGDIRKTDSGLPGYGDAVVALPWDGGIGSSESLEAWYYNGSGDLAFGDKINNTHADPWPSSLKNRWTWCRDTGLCAVYISKTVYLWKITPSTLDDWTYIGEVTCTDYPKAIGIAPNGSYLITVEVTNPVFSGSNMIRAYTIDLVTPGITLVDTLNRFTGSTNYNVQVFCSPISGRMWCAGTGDWGCYIVHVDPLTDTLVQDFHLPRSQGSTGYIGRPIRFLAAPLEVTPNGDVGIKAKLYDAWEMNETGSVNRVSSRGDGPPLVPGGTVNHRAGKIGNAPDFDGTNYLHATIDLYFPDKMEMCALSNMSFCANVLLDGKADDQHFFCRGVDTSPLSNDFQDFGLYYDVVADKLAFYITNTSGTTYKAFANDLGSPAIGTDYHVYCHYDKVNEEVAIRVNGGTLNTTSLPLATELDMSPYYSLEFYLGHKQLGADRHLLDGYVDQLFWFWDVLDSAEQTWMYNSGNSRAFSEL